MEELSNNKFKRLSTQSWRKRKNALQLVTESVPRLVARIRTIRADGTPRIGRMVFTRGPKARVFTSGEWY